MRGIRVIRGLSWNDANGYGYYEADVSSSYDNAYFDKYETYEKTELGRRLTQARIEFVRKHIGNSDLVDFGCGNGSFVKARGGRTWGYDVCMKTVKWLVQSDLWWDPWFRKMPSASFWDSLEHVKDISHLLEKVKSHMFVSIPIFSSGEHASTSKHFRPTEHFHYFTEQGFERFMKIHGFDLLESNRMETDLGREDIRTFAFCRKA